MSEHEKLRERLKTYAVGCWAYCYPDATRFETGGRTINGMSPSKSLPLYYEDTVLEFVQAELAALSETNKRVRESFEDDLVHYHKAELAARNETIAKLREVVKLLTTTGTSYNWGVLEKASALLAEGDK